MKRDSEFRGDTGKCERLRRGDHRMFLFLEAEEMLSWGDAKAWLEPGSHRREVGETWTQADPTPRALGWHTSL